MDGPTPIIWSVNNFSVTPGNINLNVMEQLTINIESNGVNHQLVLIKPWPPLYRVPHTQLDKLRGLVDNPNDIESVKIFQDSDNPRIEITMENENENGITIHCDSIELS